MDEWFRAMRARFRSPVRYRRDPLLIPRRAAASRRTSAVPGSTPAAQRDQVHRMTVLSMARLAMWLGFLHEALAERRSPALKHVVSVFWNDVGLGSCFHCRPLRKSTWYSARELQLLVCALPALPLHLTGSVTVHFGEAEREDMATEACSAVEQSLLDASSSSGETADDAETASPATADELCGWLIAEEKEILTKVRAELHGVRDKLATRIRLAVEAQRTEFEAKAAAGQKEHDVQVEHLHGVIGELKTQCNELAEQLEMTRRMLDRSSMLIGARRTYKEAMVSGTWSVSHVLHEWSRVATADRRERDKRFAAARLRRRILCRSVFGSWAEAVRRASRTKDKAAFVRQLQQELAHLRDRKDAQLRLAAEHLAVSRQEADDARRDAAQLHDRVRSLLAHGFHQVGLNAAKAVEATLGIADGANGDDAAHSASTFPAQAGAMGLLSLLLESQVGQLRSEKGAKKHRRPQAATPPPSPPPPKPALASTRSQAIKAARSLPQSSRTHPEGVRSASKRTDKKLPRQSRASLSDREIARRSKERGVLELTASIDGKTTGAMPHRPQRGHTTASGGQAAATSTSTPETQARPVVAVKHQEHDLAARVGRTSSPGAVEYAERSQPPGRPGGVAANASLQSDNNHTQSNAEAPVVTAELRTYLGGPSLSRAMRSLLDSARREMQVDAAADTMDSVE